MMFGPVGLFVSMFLFTSSTIACSFGPGPANRLNSHHHGQDQKDLRIVGGTTVEPHEFPFIVWIKSEVAEHNSQYTSSQPRSQFFWDRATSQPSDTSSPKWITNCAGAILSQDWIVTAAHCVFNNKTDSYRIYAGVHDRSNLQQVQIVSPIRIMAHHHFSWQNATNDIALVQVSPKFQFNKAMQAIHFVGAQFDAEINCSKVVTAGWGLYNNRKGNLVTSKMLKKVSSQLAPNTNCSSTYSGIISIQESHLCTDTVAGKGSCFGDSGAPVICKSKSSNGSSSEFILVGLVSGSNGCGNL